MGVKVAVVGSVMAGLVAVGGFAAVAAYQPAPVRKSVELVQPAAVVSDAPTVAPTVEPTVEPTAVPTTVAPAPVQSTKAPAPVVAPTSEAPVAKPEPVQPAAPAAAPVEAHPQPPTPLPRNAPDCNGTPIRDGNGNLIPDGGCQSSDPKN